MDARRVVYWIFFSMLCTYSRARSTYSNLEYSDESDTKWPGRSDMFEPNEKRYERYV